MHRLRYYALGVVMLMAAGIGVYRALPRDPDAPRNNWPVLQAAAPAADAGWILVGRNVHVSQSRELIPFGECLIAADPEDPSRLLAAGWYNRRADRGVVTFVSRDGGGAWQLGCERIARAGEAHGDPSVCIGRDGMQYLVYMRFDPRATKPLGSEGTSSLRFLASADGGNTWDERASVARLIDRPRIVADSASEPGMGLVYCLGNIDEPILLVSTDGARSFGAPVTPLAGNKLNNVRPANPVVLANGDLLLVYEDRDTRGARARHRPRLFTLRSSDGGRTLRDGAPVNTQWWHETIRSSKNEIGAACPHLAADPGSRRFARHAYCVWMDGNNHEGQRVFFSASPDGGATWNQAVVISEQPMQGGSGGEYLTCKPSVAVNRDGVVAVSWYDRRGLPKSTLVPQAIEDGGVSAYQMVAEGWNVRLRASLDGGATWLPSAQVNEQQVRGGIDLPGHMAGLAAAADGRFHPVWIDDRTGEFQVWTATVEVGVRVADTDGPSPMSPD